MSTIGVVGLGLIGGSLALATQRVGHLVLCWDADDRTRADAVTADLSVTEDLSAADLVVFAVPMPYLTDRLAQTLAGLHLSESATIGDVGSLKQPVAGAMRGAGLSARYVGGHPMAGSERSGFGAADPDLFHGVRWALCPSDEQPGLDRWWQLAAVITELGAGVVPITPADHDSAMGLVSGLPHLLALALAASAVRAGPLVTELAARSFADLTRVAGSDPTLLRALTEDNGPAVRAALRHLLEQFDRPWADLIEDGHAARKQLLLQGKDAGSPALVETTVTGPADLLELGRAGAVIEAVEPETGRVRYRRPRAP